VRAGSRKQVSRRRARKKVNKVHLRRFGVTSASLALHCDDFQLTNW
jgi:hypothetical protein